MKKLWVFLLIFCLLSGFTAAETASADLIPGKARIVFADQTEAAAILKTKDDFINSLSRFDRMSILKTDQLLPIDEFCNRIASEALAWDPGEIVKITNIIDSIKGKLQPLKLDLPERIFLIKTTGNEEGHAAYTRGQSIFLPQKYVDYDSNRLEQTLIHELFHVYSRANREKRDQLYRIIGFSRCPPLQYPNELRDLKITNPDTTDDHYITVRHQGKTIPVIPVLYANRPYDAAGGLDFFAYMSFGLLAVKISKNDCTALFRNGTLFRNGITLIPPNPSYLEQIGQNTNYIINPEEILADNFVLLVNQEQKVKSPFVIAGMMRVLRE